MFDSASSQIRAIIAQKRHQKTPHTLTKKQADDMRIMLKLDVKIDLVKRAIIKLEGGYRCQIIAQWFKATIFLQFKMNCINANR